jgi:hypothetical protein
VSAEVVSLVPTDDAVERWLADHGWKLHPEACTLTVSTWCSPSPPQRWITVVHDSAPALRPWHLRTIATVHQVGEHDVLSEMLAEGGAS